MPFGSCCFLDGSNLTKMEAQSIKIEGVQHGLIANFEVTQVFMHFEEKTKEVRYIFPNDFKMCIYDTTFVVDQEIIKPKLKRKKDAETIYEEAIQNRHTAIFGSNIASGLTQFKLGNLPPKTECKVILKVSFAAQMTKDKTFFIKFPLDVYNPSGSLGCLNVNSCDFFFQIQSEKEKIAKITSNVKDGKFDEETKTFSINNSIENAENLTSIIVTFESLEKIESSAIITKDKLSNYEYCTLTISPNFEPSKETNSEFIFVVDCSGSMGGQSIKNASECLELFIRSLPTDSFFNVIQFGSTFHKLFNKSMKYNDETAGKAIDLAINLLSNLGGTNIYDPLKEIFSENNEHGQRQVFVITDGEVENVESVLQLVKNNSNKNRCFSLGIGRGCDAGLIEGIANLSGGICDFVQKTETISAKVIPQLQSSFYPLFNHIEINVEDNDSFEISPFPIVPINNNGASIVYLRTKIKEEKPNYSSILINGKYGNEPVEISIQNIERIDYIEEDELGCSGGKNLANAIIALFSFSFLQAIEKKDEADKKEIENAIEISISSGVLCKYTGYVGIVSKPHLSWNMSSYSSKIVDTQYSCKHRTDSWPTSNFRSPRKSLHSCGWGSSCITNEDDEEENTKQIQKKNKNDLLALTRCQNISGFWNNLDDINQILGLNVNSIDGINIDDKNLEQNCIATILAIAAIHVKSEFEMDSWKLIEQKAVSWLKKTLPNIDIDEIIARIEKLIK